MYIHKSKNRWQAAEASAEYIQVTCPTMPVEIVSLRSTRFHTLMIQEQEIQDEFVWFGLPPNMKLPNERKFAELLSM